MASLEKNPRLVSGMIVALIAGAFLLDLSVPLGVNDWALYLIPLCITFWLKGRNHPLLIAASCTVLIYVELVLSPPSIPFTIATVNSSFGALVLWLVALLFMLHKRDDEKHLRLIGELQDAMAEIKVLRGILTICSRCKQIRDEEGHWLPVEVYVGDRSSADFSHVICPDCLDKHFTDRHY
jgi:hypothetical protein